MKKIAAISALVLAAAVFGWWVKDGMGSTTMTEIETCTKTVDDFDEVVEECKWEKGFKLGLLDGALPVGGALIGMAGVLLFLDFRDKKKPA